MNPYVFLVGCPRSGTTLLRRMVQAHPQIAITPETHWIVKTFNRRDGLTPEGHVTPALLEQLGQDERFTRLEPDVSELERLIADPGPVHYSRFVSAVFDAFGRAREKPLVGDKTPGYSLGIPTLAELWPEARFVHIVRDGRDVCLSAMNWTRKLPSLESRYPTWRSEPAITAALWWDWHARAAHEDGRALGDHRFHELRYEELVSESESTCSALCDFLGVPYDAAMLRFHEGRTKSKPGLSAKKAWLPVTPGLRNWRTELPEAEVAGFEAAAGPLLEGLGYERVFDVLPDSARERAAAVREAIGDRLGEAARAAR
jgi:hypothetical protein